MYPSKLTDTELSPGDEFFSSIPLNMRCIIKFIQHIIWWNFSKKLEAIFSTNFLRQLYLFLNVEKKLFVFVRYTKCYQLQVTWNAWCARKSSQQDYRDIINWSLIKNNWSSIRERKTSRDTGQKKRERLFSRLQSLNRRSEKRRKGGTMKKRRAK